MGVTEFVIVQLQAEFVGDGDITQKTLPGTRMGLVDKVVDRNSAEVHHVLAFREDGTNKRGLRCDLDFGFRSFGHARSEEHTSELQSLMRISYAVFCLKK